MQSKYLVVYYSRTGTTRAVAVALAKALHCDIEAIVDTNKRAGIWGYLRCVLDTLEKRSATIAPPKKDISGYELVIVGTPVWAGSVAAPVRAYLEMQKSRLPLLAFFCTLRSRGAETALAQMQQLSGKVPCAELAVMAREINGDGFQQRISEFVKTLARHLKMPSAKRKGRHKILQHNEAPSQHEEKAARDHLIEPIADSHAID